MSGAKGDTTGHTHRPGDLSAFSLQWCVLTVAVEGPSDEASRTAMKHIPAFVERATQMTRMHRTNTSEVVSKFNWRFIDLNSTGGAVFYARAHVHVCSSVNTLKNLTGQLMDKLCNHLVDKGCWADEMKLVPLTYISMISDDGDEESVKSRIKMEFI